MITDRTIRPWLALILAGLVLINCNEEERYRVLSFFFDGVPIPASMRKPQAVTDSTTRDSSITLAQSRNLPAAKPKVVETHWFLHKPFSEKKCSYCHLGDMGQRLQMERVDELCKTCHEQFKVSHQYVHGPVAIGQCLVCHNPHRTQYPHLTIRPGDQLCRYCHKTVKRTSAPEHYFIGEKVCYECHNPHFSDSSQFFVQSATPK